MKKCAAALALLSVQTACYLVDNPLYAQPTGPGGMDDDAMEAGSGAETTEAESSTTGTEFTTTGSESATAGLESMTSMTTGSEFATTGSEFATTGSESTGEIELEPSPEVMMGEIILQSGKPLNEISTPDDPVVGKIYAPFVESSGGVSFIGSMENTDEVFIYSDVDEPFVWNDETGMLSIEIIEIIEIIGTSEISDVSTGTRPGEFILSVEHNGNDGLYTHSGWLTQAGDPAPAVMEAESVSHDAPTMFASGAVYWVAGLDTNSDEIEDRRVLYRSPDATVDNTEVVLQTDDMIGEFSIANPNGIDLDYQFSLDENNHIHVLKLDGSDGEIDAVYINSDDCDHGCIVAQAGESRASGWASFEQVAINNLGTYAFTGRISGDSDDVICPVSSSKIKDQGFLAVNGETVINGCDSVDGINLKSGTSVRMVALNNHDHLAFVWGYDRGEQETLFFSCEPTDPAAAQALLKIGDQLDLDGDGVGDGFVTDFRADKNTPGRPLTDDGSLYLSLGIGDVTTMVRLQMPDC